jgi:hypothetical protein
MKAVWVMSLMQKEDSPCDLYFKDSESTKQFRNFYFSFTGEECPRVVSCDYFNESCVLNNIDKRVYHFTTDNYVDGAVVKAYLALFPEEEDV